MSLWVSRAVPIRAGLSGPTPESAVTCESAAQGSLPRLRPWAQQLVTSCGPSSSSLLSQAHSQGRGRGLREPAKAQKTPWGLSSELAHHPFHEGLLSKQVTKPAQDIGEKKQAPLLMRDAVCHIAEDVNSGAGGTFLQSISHMPPWPGPLV